MRTRDEALAALTEHAYEVLVIGGGITGAGVGWAGTRCGSTPSA